MFSLNEVPKKIMSKIEWKSKENQGYIFPLQIAPSSDIDNQNMPELELFQFNQKSSEKMTVP